MMHLRLVALIIFTAATVTGVMAIAQDAPVVDAVAPVSQVSETIEAPVAPADGDGAVVIAPDAPADFTAEVPGIVAPAQAPTPSEETPVVAEEAITPVADEAAPSPDEAAATPTEEAVPATADATGTTDLPKKPVVPLPALSEDDPVQKDILTLLRLRKPTIDIEKMPSLLMTVWERDLIINARKGALNRDPDAPDIVEEAMAPPESQTEAPVNYLETPRDIRLSGIIWNSSNDWVIWLNAKRISPTRIPQEIMNIKVYKTYVEMEWFDQQTNQIFPIRLRPHQRFNLDARIFLPG